MIKPIKDNSLKLAICILRKCIPSTPKFSDHQWHIWLQIQKGYKLLDSIRLEIGRLKNYIKKNCNHRINDFFNL